MINTLVIFVRVLLQLVIGIYSLVIGMDLSQKDLQTITKGPYSFQRLFIMNFLNPQKIANSTIMQLIDQNCRFQIPFTWLFHS